MDLLKETLKEQINCLRIDLGRLRRRLISEENSSKLVDIEDQINILEEEINDKEKYLKNLNKLNLSSVKTMAEASIPPFIINDLNPVRTQSETIDWGMNTLQIPQIHKEFGLTGKGVKVAVIDTLVNSNHEDLVGAVIQNNNVTNENIPEGNGHGTGCSGVIGGRRNDKGILGVAPDCQIIGIKALTEGGSGSLEGIANAINLAVDRGVHVINLSLGGPATIPALEQAVNRAASAGIYVIAAAGNSGSDNSVGYPAKYPTVVAVGAVNQSNKASAFTSRGSEVDIAAPGERILTSWKNNTYATVSGTSFATPYVAGCFALFVQAGIKMNHSILKETAIDVEEPGQDLKSGYGLINPYEIIKRYYKKNVEPCAKISSISTTDIGTNKASIRWEIAPNIKNYSVQVFTGNQLVSSTSNFSGNVVNLTNLKENTEYKYSIVANCNDGQKSEPSVGNFTTLKASVDTSKLSQAVNLIQEFINSNK